MKTSIKEHLFRILDKPQEGDKLSKAFDVFILGLIVLNIAGFVVETLPDLPPIILEYLRYFELFSVLVFTIEYCLRLWTSDINAGSKYPRIRFACSSMSIIDLAAILPSYMAFIGSASVFLAWGIPIPQDLRVLRVFRLIRVIKMLRYSNSLQRMRRVFWSKRVELGITLYVAILLWILASTAMFYAERSAQPDKFGTIPHAMWWGGITLTTIGYGDVYPVTGIGKIIALLTAILGIGMFALPTAILGSAFLSEIEKKRGLQNKCPHCGKDIADLSE